MSSYLWKHYLEDDVEQFCHFLETASYNVRANIPRGAAGGLANVAGTSIGSPSTLSTSPRLNVTARKPSGKGRVPRNPSAVLTITRAELNARDSHGLTLLHHAASSTAENSVKYALSLVEHPLTDLYLQDFENGWTALHRAFYFGNITVARAILNRDLDDALGRGSVGVVQHAGGLVKIKDKEGNAPFDLLAMTIKDRTLHPHADEQDGSGSFEDNDDDAVNGVSGDDEQEDGRKAIVKPSTNIEGDELFTFGSNKNITLGFGDEDDRQYPERISLRRPDHLLRRFYREYLEDKAQEWGLLDETYRDRLLEAGESKPISSLPSLVRSKPIVIQDVYMSKLHTAILTADPEANLYMCGHGTGGRLGTGSERTQFAFACIEGGALESKKVVAVALGQNHSLALSSEGEVLSWGSNAFGQLGYLLPKTNFKDEDAVQLLPRQIFGPLKREIITGTAASRIHSVAYTTSALYTFGKNEGQLGIVDSDARSLEMQVLPRRVAASLFSSPLKMASAIDRATVCLLEDHEVWVFANFGYSRLVFPLDGFSNYFLKNSFLTTKYDARPNTISKVGCGGDTICGMSTTGEIFAVSVGRPVEQGAAANTSTTNPNKIRNALSTPFRIWSPKKAHMAARDVGVDQDGSVILTTEAGSVWRRTKRAMIKDASAAGTGEYKPKDYKFSRIPGLTRVLAVRASAFGAYAMVRKDCDVTKTQIIVDVQNVWKDVYALLSFRGLALDDAESETPAPRFWRRPTELDLLRKAILESKDLEKDLTNLSDRESLSGSSSYDMFVGVSTSDAAIPVDSFIFAGRSRILRHGLAEYRRAGSFALADLLSIVRGSDGKPRIEFKGLDFLTVVNLTLYTYTDTVVDFWHYAQRAPALAFRYRQVRTELMRVASKLELQRLEPAVRQMTEPRRSLDMDFELALKDPTFFEDGDIILELADANVSVHSKLLCQRCPFFESLFKGRAGGRWLDDRRIPVGDSGSVNVDLKHVHLNTFQLVLRHIYADTGEELFDDVVAADRDEFLDVVMDVLSVANELLLDRLSQICQKVLGRFINNRTACQLLNAVAPSSVTELKEAGLEYLCLSLEAVLENHLLDELDEDLLLELDQVVRENQLACLPFVRSGRAEALLHERHPELAEMIDRAKRAKIDAINVRAKHFEGAALLASSFDDFGVNELGTTPSQHQRRRRPSKEHRSMPPSPDIRAKQPTSDLMFHLEEEDRTPSTRIAMSSADFHDNAEVTRHFKNQAKRPSLSTPILKQSSGHSDPIPQDSATGEPTVESTESCNTLLGSSSVEISIQDAPLFPTLSAKQSWAALPLKGDRLDMKDIMAQASSSRTSNLSLGLSAQRASEKMAGSFSAKLSQRERKKQQQAQETFVGQVAPSIVEPAVATPVAGKPSAPPWQVPSRDTGGASQGVQEEQPQETPTPAPAARSNSSRSTTPHLTMRQTIANPGSTSKPGSTTKQTAPTPNSPQVPAQPHTEPDSGEDRSPAVSTPVCATTLPRPSPSPHQPRQASSNTPRQPSKPGLTPPSGKGFAISDPTSPPPIPQSIRHVPAPAHTLSSPSQQLSMADILSQEQAKKDAVKEAASKKSLADIQAEQEFQAWWDVESARVQGEERDRDRDRDRGESRSTARRGAKGRGSRRGRGGTGNVERGEQRAEGGHEGLNREERRGGTRDAARGRGGARGLVQHGGAGVADS